MPSLHDRTLASIAARDAEFVSDLPRFVVRSILGGVYLTLGTAFALIAGAAVEPHAPGLGVLVFALFFGLGLFSIVILAAELATGNMMFAVYSVVMRQVPAGRAMWMVLVCTLFNLVGALLVGLLLGQATKFTGLTPDHLLGVISSGKMAKTPGPLFVEAMLANFVVNMGILGALRTDDVAGKFITIVAFIAIFVGLGLEHIIANFSLFSLALFALPEVLSAGGVAVNVLVVWVGNFLGGGLLMGGVYAWLSRPTAAPE